MSSSRCFGKRRARRVRRDRIEPDRDGDGYPTVLRREQIRPPVLVHLPVHERRAAVDDLHPVHADVARARVRVLRDDGRQRDERRRDRRASSAGSGVARGRRRRPRRRPPGTAPSRPVFGRESATDFSFRSPLTFSRSPCGRLHVEDVAELRGRVVELLDAEREAHAPLGAELVDEERVLRALRVLEEERRPARLDDAIGDLGDLEVGIGLDRDTPKLALALGRPFHEEGAGVLDQKVLSLRAAAPAAARRC